MKIIRNFDLTGWNSYKIKSICKRAFFPDTEEDIRTIFSNFPGDKKIIGSGHNIIFSKEYYDSDFIVFSGNFNKVTITKTEIAAEAGVFMPCLSEQALSKNLCGLEVFYDIPSSLGGAVVMNAGAGNEEIRSILKKVRFYNPLEDTFNIICNNEIAFEYRNSFFQQNPHLIVCHAWLQLKHADRHTIEQKMCTVKKERWAKQPRNYPNAGSVFKRPPGYYVGVMMDELQLKGYAVGGAKVSKKHGSFIVNHNNATGKDIIDLISVVKDRVYQKYAVNIEVEQRII